MCLPAGTRTWMAQGSTTASLPVWCREHGTREQEMDIVLCFKHIYSHPALLEVQHRSQFFRLTLRALDLTELWRFKDQHLCHVIIIANFYFVSVHSSLNVIEDTQSRTGMDWYTVKHNPVLYMTLSLPQCKRTQQSKYTGRCVIGDAKLLRLYGQSIHYYTLL